MKWVWRIGLFLVGAAALALRVRHLDVGPEPEEGWFYAMARGLGTGLDRFTPAPPALGHLLERPLFFLAYLPASWIGGLAACRAQAALVSALLAPAVALAARRFGVAWPLALGAGALIAVEEVGTRFAARLLPGPLAMLLALVGIALVLGRERPRLGWVLLAAATLVDHLSLLAPLAASLLVPTPRRYALLSLAPAALLTLIAVVAGAHADPLWAVPGFGARVFQAGFLDLAFVPLLALAAVLGRGLFAFALGPAAILVARHLLADRGAELWQGAVLVPCGVLLIAAAAQALFVELPRWRGALHGRAVVAVGFAAAFGWSFLSESSTAGLRGLPVRFSLYWATTHVGPDPGRPAFLWTAREKPDHLIVAGCPWGWAIHPLGRRAGRVTFIAEAGGYELDTPADALVYCDLSPFQTPRPDCPWQRAGRFVYVDPKDCPR